MYVCEHVCFYVCCSDCVGSVGMFVVYQPLLKIGCFSLGVLKYVVWLCKGFDRCCVFVCIVTRGAVLVYGKYKCFVMRMCDFYYVVEALRHLM